MLLRSGWREREREREEIIKPLDGVLDGEIMIIVGTIIIGDAIQKKDDYLFSMEYRPGMRIQWH